MLNELLEQDEFDVVRHDVGWPVDDTFLTPYSTSTMTDSAVESLPILFLAYCAINSADQA